MSELSKRLGFLMIKRATDFVGLVEIKSNAVWDDPNTAAWDRDKSRWLTEWMSKVQGWTPGAPYCAAFDGAIAAACLEAMGFSSKHFLASWTAHVMTNVRLLRKLKYHSEIPTLGAIWLARFGDTDRGHAGIVATHGARSMTTVEGNTMKETSDAGDPNKQRAGDGIWIRGQAITGRGKLRTQCFCSTDAILTLAKVNQ